MLSNKCFPTFTIHLAKEIPMSRRIMLILVWLGLGANFSLAQDTNATDEVRLFQNFFQDAPIAVNPYGEGFFQYSTFDNDFSTIDVAVQGALPVADKLQLGGGVGFRSISPGVGDGQSGISDLLVSGRYNVMPGPTSISVGAFATLPVGSEDIGEGTFDFSGFGSLRHYLPSGMALTGTFGLEFIETKTFRFNPITGQTQEGSNRDTSVLIAGGLIYPTRNGINIVSELSIRTEGDFVLLTGALDYALKTGGRVRGGIGIGLDDGAPNFALRGGYFLNL
jgi:hypothetical protein